MKITQFKSHFSAVHERVKRMNQVKNQHVVGNPHHISKYRMVGYFHKSRMHKTDLTLKDFDFLRYMMPAGENYHYFEGEMCIKDGRKDQQVVKKILVCKQVNPVYYHISGRANRVK